MTEDHDFKALVRERMAKTGESYTTARQHLLEESAAARPDGGGAFALSTEESASAAAAAVRASVQQLEHGGMEIDDDHVRVWLGDPPSFEARIPRSQIRAVTRVPDKAAGSSLGAHGWRGRWLVNTAYTGLVRLDVEPAARADLRVSNALPAGAMAKTPLLLRPLLRNRQVKLRQLTVSTADPDAVVAALGG